MFAGKKTYITAAIAVITAVGAYLTGDATIMQTAQLCFTAILAAFVRRGIVTDVRA